MRGVARCYGTVAPALGRPAAFSLARRDVLVWWRAEVAAMARALRAIADRAWADLRVDVRAFYRTSPPSSERWIRYGARAPANATAALGLAPGGGARAPLGDAAAVFAPPDGADEYGHELFAHVDDAAVAAFAAAGHGVLDVSTMLGQRVDAHPGSRDGRSDALHFCCPGPLDYVLDLLVSAVGAAFRRGRPAPPSLKVNRETAKLLVATGRAAGFDKTTGAVTY